MLNGVFFAEPCPVKDSERPKKLATCNPFDPIEPGLGKRMINFMQV
jgi:hypothetical protein